ncbi:tumor necrosis factor ligand superfamily member 14 [Crotalus tigris]|uniref:tumor necrosis factor ligand superfamily member 14 n=1 Tax=Crotalus tigris TaxID=88082 RepID=UPI00192F7209|nr:tumor necrosis factor ligand superfamily member 14 [Crotalus tigris]
MYKTQSVDKQHASGFYSSFHTSPEGYMMEAATGYPSVFVVDPTLRDVPFAPPRWRSRKKWQAGQLFLGFLVLLMLSGLTIQTYLLISFRKELDTAMAQGTANATAEKIIQAPLKLPLKRPSAHLTLEPPDTAIIDGVLQWEHQNGFAFLHDMDYKAGSLISNEPGYYYVYSKLTLTYSSCLTKHRGNSLFTHSVYKRTSQYPEELLLLTNYITYCNSKDSEQWQGNSFLAGVVYLEEEEEVFIKVTNGELLFYRDDSISHFGTFMI